MESVHRGLFCLSITTFFEIARKVVLTNKQHAYNKVGQDRGAHNNEYRYEADVSGCIPPKNKHSFTIRIVSIVHKAVNTKMTRFRKISVTKSLFSEKMRFTP